MAADLSLPVYINGRFLTQQLTGVQRYATEIVRAMDLSLAEIGDRQRRFVLLVPKGARQDLQLETIQIEEVGKRGGHLWEQTTLRSASADGVLLSLANTGPILHKRQIVTIHDASVYANPGNFSFAFRTWYKILLPLLGKRARRIVTVSNFSKGELAKYCGIDESKIVVAPNGADHILRPEADPSILKARGLMPRKYVLFVGSESPNKNISLVLEAFSILENRDLSLVAVGGASPKVFAGVGSLSAPTVNSVGYQPDSVLRALYENALCFVFPSLYEGFGIPPLEAMLCNCPAIVANTSSLPEACGSGALYIDPYDAEDLADKIRRVATDRQLAANLRRFGKKHAAKFTWQASSQKILALIDQV